MRCRVKSAQNFRDSQRVTKLWDTEDSELLPFWKCDNTDGYEDRIIRTAHGLMSDEAT